jgi:RNA polymerase primary sigma factor
VRRAPRTVVSLDAPLGDDDDTSLGDRLESDEQPAEEVELSLQRESLQKALSALPEREREIVQMRYGLSGEEPKSIDQVVSELGATRSAVRRLEKRALARLGRARELAGMKEAAS